MNEKQLLEKINNTTNSFVLSLPEVNSLSLEDSKKIIKRQVVAFEWNFIVWLSSVLITAKSDKSKIEIVENLTEELKDNHAWLLRSFAKSGDSLPSLNDYEFLDSEISDIRLLVSEMSWLKNLVLMTILEDTSPECMKLLSEASKKINSIDNRYPDIHYTLDLWHSEDLKKALVEEIKFYDNVEEKIDDSINKAINLLKKIWLI